MDDLKLISLLEKGDKDAFTQIFERYYAPLVAYINQYTHDFSEAEDLVQNCFTIIWEKRERLTISTSVKSYLYSTAYNLYIDAYRKNRKISLYLDSLKSEALNEIVSESAEDLKKQLEVLNKAIEALPPKCREIFILNKKEGLSYKDIARQLDISVKTVEAQIRIALIKIRERLKKNSLIFLFLLKR